MKKGEWEGSGEREERGKEEGKEVMKGGTERGGGRGQRGRGWRLTGLGLVPVGAAIREYRGLH
jgi:hypothetical protein